ncbi:alpha-n-acetylgalactosaminidase-like [Plakobranchus ocellatus]|uniref:alpha-galactosidase n=1 Tax=Plakobranchus ocellatus TaxID=259542 RepID=A0AAV4AVB1_9GAST|nr:alpha-n-acetylgalactosaminidase-like [Plakobranchus ocellatus]
MAAPLLLSNDLREVIPEARALMQNPGVISINQDKLGIMGKRIWQKNGLEGWLRPVTPEGSYAVAVLNLSAGGDAVPVNVSLASLGVKGQDSFNVTEVFSGELVGNATVQQNLTFSLDTNSVLLLRYTKI